MRNNHGKAGAVSECILEGACQDGFALLVDPEQAGARYDGITGGPHVAPKTELRYCLRYRFLPEGRRGRAALWVEDTGVCLIDVESRPSVAQGTLRVINDRREREERLLYLGSHDELTGQLNQRG